MKSKIERVAVMYETGEDESFLLGTKEELATFAQTILSVLDQPLKAFDFNGTKAYQVISKKSLTEPLSDICLSGLVIVDTVKDRKKLINKIRIKNGSDPIDWKDIDRQFKSI